MFVAPLRIAGGIAGKTLDALAGRLPGRDHDARQRRSRRHSGEHLLVADAPEAFAATIVRLLRDPPQRRRLGEAARASPAERYGPGVSAAALEREHEAVAATPVLTRRSGA